MSDGLFEDEHLDVKNYGYRSAKRFQLYPRVNDDPRPGDIWFDGSTFNFRGTIATSTLTGGGSTGTAQAVVGPDSALYPTDGVADDVQINAAMLDVFNAGGGKVYLGVGTYWQTDVIQLRSNVDLIGTGWGSTTIKSIANYEPASSPTLGAPNPNDGRIQLSSITPIENVVVEGITWDNNVQNQRTDLNDITHHRSIMLHFPVSFTFRNCKVFNSINWAICILNGTKTYIHDNVVLGGYALLADHPNNDGITVRGGSKDTYIYNNYVDTTFGGLTNGDDAIVLSADAAGGTTIADSYNIQVFDNTVISYLNGIRIAVDDSFDMTKVNVHDNNIRARVGGITMEKFASTGDGSSKMIDFSIVNNKIDEYGITTGTADCGIHFLAASQDETSFEDLKIALNTIRGSLSTVSYGIKVYAKGSGLKIDLNDIADFSGIIGIEVGKATNPIKGVSIFKNTIDLATAASSVIGIRAYGCSRGLIAGNVMTGHLTGTTYAIQLVAGATAGNDSLGVANAEPCEYLSVYGNNIYNFDNGIVEIADTGTPNNNSIHLNQFNTVANTLTILGANTKAFNGDPTSGHAMVLGTPSSALHAGTNIGYMSSVSGPIQFSAESTASSSSTAGPGAAFYSNDGAAMASGDKLGFVLFGGSSNASAVRNSAAVTAFTNEAWVDASAYGTDLRFELIPPGSTTRAEKVRVTGAGNIKIGGSAARTTTEGTNQLVLFTGTAPAGNVACGVSLYVKGNELYTMDACSNETLQSPHNNKGEWVFYSKNTTTGDVIEVDMERLVKAIDKKLGGGYVKEYKEKVFGDNNEDK